MAIVVPNVGEIVQLQLIIDEELASGLVYLYQNDYTPIATSDVGDFTEADYSGYAGPQTPGWTPAATDGSGRAATVSDVMTYAHNGGGTDNTIYGFFVTNLADELLFAARFDTPVVMEDALSQFAQQITYRLREDS